MAKVTRIVKAVKDNEERQIITGLIVDTGFSRQIIPIMHLEYFKTPFAKTVAQWCSDYWEEYQDCPKEAIKDIYQSKKRNNEIEEDEADLISIFLESISDEYERTDKRPTQYMSNNAEKYFKKRSLEILKQDLSTHLSAGDIEQAEASLSGYALPELECGEGAINPFTNEDAIRSAFESSVDPLFTVPGALGISINDLLIRGGFVGIMGPEKRGKSWWLMYLARMAARAGRNVVHFVVGDMTQNQVVVRHHIMNTRRSNKPKYCYPRLIPILDCLYNQTGECKSEDRLGDDIVATTTTDEFDRKTIICKEYKDADYHIPCTECYKDKELKKNFKGAHWWRESEQVEPLDWKDAFEYGQKFAQNNMPGKHFKLSCHVRQEINVKGIRQLLKKWEAEEGFIADVIVLDYADNLGAEHGKNEFRHQQNDTWGALRGISQEIDCLVITATQADAASYDAKVITEKNFSEDKRKYSHVTGIITLNQTKKEKRAGVMRIGKLFVREDDIDTNELVTVLQNLAAGQPVTGSYF